MPNSYLVLRQDSPMLLFGLISWNGLWLITVLINVVYPNKGVHPVDFLIMSAGQLADSSTCETPSSSLHHVTTSLSILILTLSWSAWWTALIDQLTIQVWGTWDPYRAAGAMFQSPAPFTLWKLFALPITFSSYSNCSRTA